LKLKILLVIIVLISILFIWPNTLDFFLGTNDSEKIKNWINILKNNQSDSEIQEIANDEFKEINLLENEIANNIMNFEDNDLEFATSFY